ncbi:MAG: cbb3-type cytochrome c oxidase subunit II, partial [Alphaproteobacteria bacterium]|nr:cbb3-type cytochrome c oxidase subunit II [Alphaproteobacteria bacterium]
ESIMPTYAFLMKRAAKLDDIGAHLKTLRITGVPYTDAEIENATNDAYAQAQGSGHDDASGLQSRYGDKVNVRDFDGQPELTSEMDALVAYLQVLGTMVDFNATKDVEKGAQ